MDTTPPEITRIPPGPDRLSSGEIKKTIDLFFHYIPEKYPGIRYSDKIGDLLLARTQMDNSGIVSHGEVTLMVDYADAIAPRLRTNTYLHGGIQLNSPLKVEDAGMDDLMNMLNQQPGIISTWHRGTYGDVRTLTIHKDNERTHITIDVPQPQEASDRLVTNIYPHSGNMTSQPLFDNQMQLTADLADSVPVALDLMKQFMEGLNSQLGRSRVFTWYAPELVISQDKNTLWMYDKNSISGGAVGRIISIGDRT